MSNFSQAGNRSRFCLSPAAFLLVAIAAGYAGADSASVMASPPSAATDSTSEAPANRATSDTRGDLVTPDFLKAAGFIARSLDPAGTITGNLKDRIIYALGDLVFMDIGEEKGAKVGDKYIVVTEEREIYHPVLGNKSPENAAGYLDSIKNLLAFRKKFMGYLVRQWGTVAVVETHPRYAKARIIEAFDRIVDGYRLLPYEEYAIPPRQADHASPARDIEGYIVAVKREAASILGENEVVYIDKGENDNVSPGDRFRIYDLREMGDGKSWYSFLSSPPEIIRDRHAVGEIVVIATRPETATAVIAKSDKEIVAGMFVASMPTAN